MKDAPSQMTIGQDSMMAGAPGGKGLQTAMIYVLPAIFTLFTWNSPGTVQLYFAVSTVSGLFIQAVLRSPAIRRMLGIAPKPPKYDPDAAKPTNPYKGTLVVEGREREQVPNQPPAAPKPARGPGLFSKTLGGLAPVKYFKDSYNKAKPSMHASAQKTRKKNAAQKATDYEARRQREIEEERAMYAQEIENLKRRSKGAR